MTIYIPDSPTRNAGRPPPPIVPIEHFAERHMPVGQILYPELGIFPSIVVLDVKSIVLSIPSHTQLVEVLLSTDSFELGPESSEHVELRPI